MFVVLLTVSITDSLAKVFLLRVLESLCNKSERSFTVLTIHWHYKVKETGITYWMDQDRLHSPTEA